MKLPSAIPAILSQITALTLFIPGAMNAAPWETEGAVSRNDNLYVFEGKAAVVVPIERQTDQALAFFFQEGSGTATMTLLENDQETKQFQLRKDKAGDALTGRIMQRNAEGEKWDFSPKGFSLTYRPAENAKPAQQNLEDFHLHPQGWYNREIQMRLIRRDKQISVYMDGVLALVHKAEPDANISLRISLPAGDSLQALHSEATSVSPNFQPLDIRAFTSTGAKQDKETIKDGVPFLVPEKSASVDLRKAQWPFARDLPSNYFASYDSGPMYLHDLRSPTFWAPVQDYSILHLLVRRTEDAEKFGKRFSVRVGTYGLGALGGREQVLQLDYQADIPEKKGEQIISIPFTEAIAQDLGDTLQLMFSKELYLSRRAPDPSRFEFRPLGLSPGMEILGATLERAPVQMRLSAAESGNVFEGEKKASFTASLENVTEQSKSYTIETIATDSNHKEARQQLNGTLKPGEKKEIPLTFTETQWGYYDLSVRLVVDSKSLHRKTSFALLPPDTRKYRTESPFGTWTFAGGHFTCDQPDILGSLLKKAGLRFGMGKFPEERVQWGVQDNFEAKNIKEPKQYEDWVAKNPDALPVALLMHEHSISADHASRVPDAFTGRKPYVLSEKEKERFKVLWDEQIAMAKLMREHFPKVHLRLGNGPLPTKEEFLRAKFPAELFDSLGNEAGSFGRLPEAQPPDFVGNNSSIWMDHELLKTYGYNKPVTQCYEITYPSTNPGNLSYPDQAAYLVRHCVHSLAWEIPEIRFGCLEDVGNAYRFSNWGASGLLNAWPHLNPKPSYVAVATMTRVLDGVKFKRALETGSASVYGVEFSNRNNQSVYVFWTLRGKREITLEASGKDWTWTDWQGNPTGDGLQAMLSGMPVYLTGSGKVESIRLGSAQYEEQPAESATLISKLDNLDAWEIQSAPDPLLEYYNPLTPRRLGKFDYQIESESLRIHAPEMEGPVAIPMYGSLMAKVPPELPGKPTELGVWIKGNSGWGRVIYELEDAQGQKWTSIGASRKGEISEWMLDWLPAEFAHSKEQTVSQADWNTNDVFGVSAINFDGWRYVRFPLPGNYPGEQNPWPANSQWRWDKDGIVHYPLKLTRLIFELPQNILKLTALIPVKDQTIQIKELTTEYNTQGNPKQGIYENEL